MPARRAVGKHMVHIWKFFLTVDKLKLEPIHISDCTLHLSCHLHRKKNVEKRKRNGITRYLIQLLIYGGQYSSESEGAKKKNIGCQLWKKNMIATDVLYHLEKVAGEYIANAAPFTERVTRRARHAYCLQPGLRRAKFAATMAPNVPLQLGTALAPSCTAVQQWRKRCSHRSVCTDTFRVTRNSAKTSPKHDKALKCTSPR